MLLIILGLVTSCLTQEFLNNVPITFSMNGSTNYVPSSGGIAIPGYKFTVGYDRFSWLGIQFMSLTSTKNYDTVILQRSVNQSNGVYTCTISDYYVSEGRQTVLMSDTITNMDLISSSVSNTSQFILNIPRTLGNTNGEDWQGGNFVKVCFFTSDIAFDQNTWTKQYQICYGYEVNNNVSSYKGPFITTMTFQGANSSVYGGIYGPYVKMQLYWYRSSVDISNSSNLIIQIGSQIDTNVGNDYYVCGKGDFYGNSPTALYSDILYSGYQNGACTFQKNASSITMSYSRDIYTFDDFDVNITRSINICIIGNENNCATLDLTMNLPVMSVSSALTIFQNFISFAFLLIVSTLLAVMI